MRTTFIPGFMRNSGSSITALPYSRVNSLAMVLPGSLPCFLAMMKPTLASRATGQPKMNPLDSGPMMTSAPHSFT